MVGMQPALKELEIIKVPVATKLKLPHLWQHECLADHRDENLINAVVTMCHVNINIADRYNLHRNYSQKSSAETLY
eukprot:5623772-Amphidinium_carterae.1